MALLADILTIGELIHEESVVKWTDNVARVHVNAVNWFNCSIRLMGTNAEYHGKDNELIGPNFVHD